MDYDEYIWIINPQGARGIGDDEFFYLMNGVYSKLDYIDAEWDSYSNNKDDSWKRRRQAVA